MFWIHTHPHAATSPNEVTGTTYQPSARQTLDLLFVSEPSRRTPTRNDTDHEFGFSIGTSERGVFADPRPLEADYAANVHTGVHVLCSLG